VPVLKKSCSVAQAFWRVAVCLFQTLDSSYCLLCCRSTYLPFGTVHVLHGIMVWLVWSGIGVYKRSIRHSGIYIIYIYIYIYLGVCELSSALFLDKPLHKLTVATITFNG
jgi:hypothetical protein